MPITKKQWNNARVGDVFVSVRDMIWKVEGRWDHPDRGVVLVFSVDGEIRLDFYWWSDSDDMMPDRALVARMNGSYEFDINNIRKGGISKEDFENAVPNQTVFVDSRGNDWVIVRRIKEGGNEKLVARLHGSIEIISFNERLGGILDEEIAEIGCLNSSLARVEQRQGEKCQ